MLQELIGIHEQLKAQQNNAGGFEEASAMRFDAII
jgi:hypothetical protein